MQKDIKNKIELLAPAGNMEKFMTALHFGADAVYLSGKQFGLRAFADNFDNEQIKFCCEYAHKLNKKVYVTVNIFAKNDDFVYLKDYLVFLEQTGVDAAIMSDAGVIAYAKSVAPKLSIHLSTQANILNKYAVEFWNRQGVERIILARESSYSDIAEIIKAVPKCEIEMFVHGAMCISYSGRCLMSNYLTGRDSNRGECVQACRWSWTITEAEHTENPFTVKQDERGTYIFNSKDLNLIEYIKPLLECGVKSFKIEGRMKSMHYVATVINAYRRAIDKYYLNPEDFFVDEKLKNELTKTVHREFTSGFVFDDNCVKQNYVTSKAQTNGEFLAVVKEWHEGVATVEMRNRFKEGDTVEILSNNDSFNKQFIIKNLRDEFNNPIGDAKVVQQILKMDCAFPLSRYDILRSC